jgi:hypothetical protein
MCQGALRCAFDTLEQRRSLSDLDSYGMGRQPWITCDAASVWVLTDGCSLNDEGNSHVEANVRHSHGRGQSANGRCELLAACLSRGRLDCACC